MAPANLRKEGSAFDLTYPSKFLSFLKTRKAKVPHEQQELNIREVNI